MPSYVSICPLGCGDDVQSTADRGQEDRGEDEGDVWQRITGPDGDTGCTQQVTAESRQVTETEKLAGQQAARGECSQHTGGEEVREPGQRGGVVMW